MPTIKESEINWTEIHRLQKEREDRMNDPGWDHLEEASLPMGGWMHLMHLPIEKMSDLEKDQVQRFLDSGAMKPSDVVRIL